MTVMANKGIMGNLFGAAKQQEPLARPVVEASPSAMKPPSFGLGLSQASFSAPSVQNVGAPPALPEWAKVALSSPLPSQPMHFAKTEYPEVARNLPLPMHPVVIRDASNQAQQAIAQQQAITQTSAQQTIEPLIVPSQSSQITEGQTRILTLQSPKSVRRRKEAASELNLDDTN
jgi:hypothetical protein